jgi:alkanesulfonate monooxygenase SsuD/methylene tetrahydromethanopterin reductase-like flavin-dependent oxidoreductase (luciferase family)
MTSHPFAIVVDLDGDARTLARRAALAERAGFTAAVFTDPQVAPGQPGSIDAVQRAAFAAPLTAALGLIPVVQGVYAEPFHLATQLATLDLASAGRAGWLLGADPDAAIAGRYGRPAVTADVARRDAADTVEAARLLWDSWEDDAVVRDTRTWRYVDRDRLHYAEAIGRDWSVKGPSIIPRSPQGQLPVVAGAADASPASADIAVVQRASAADAARDAGAQRVWLELDVALTRAGDASALVAELTRLTGVVDGVRIRPAEFDVDADEIGRAVIPELRRAGLFRSPTAGDSLRRTLGLSDTVNRHTAARPNREVVPA